MGQQIKAFATNLDSQPEFNPQNSQRTTELASEKCSLTFTNVQRRMCLHGLTVITNKIKSVMPMH